MFIGNRFFDTGKTHIVGILNVTPDSFSDGGKNDSVDKALYSVQEMISRGAAMIDVGGESTRPGFTPVDPVLEMERTVPVIEKIKKRFDITVSIDTTKGSVAQCAIEAGADMINDVSGLMEDEGMAKLAAESGAALCIMHNSNYFDKGTGSVEQEPITACGNGIRPDHVRYKPWFIEEIGECLKRAFDAGVSKDRIILDPGIGFKGSYERDMEVLSKDRFGLPEGYPVLLGVSRKSVIGKTLDLDVGERGPGTMALTALAVMRRISFVRVHDVKENVQVVKMLEALRRYER